MDPMSKARQTFTEHLQNNTYPGRGLVVGRMEQSDAWLVVYFIMGRSSNSRNRRFAFDGERLWTEPVDLSKVEDPSLIIYDAMLATNGCQLVSNGDQTRTLFEGLRAEKTFAEALSTREREPDAPNFTPRISAMIDVSQAGKAISLSILKANKFDSALTDRITFKPADPPRGIGYGLTTYMGDGNPLPSFSGDPLILPLNGTAEDVLNAYWNALNAENRVSLAVKQVNSDGSCAKILVQNRHDN